MLYAVNTSAASVDENVINRSRHGFTLIELLVVISIVALLISILLPALAKARNSANNVDCLTRVKQLGLIFMLYEQDQKVLPVGLSPTGGWLNRVWSYLPHGGMHDEAGATYPTKGNILYCPRFPASGDVWSDPYAHSGTGWLKVHYGMNVALELISSDKIYGTKILLGDNGDRAGCTVLGGYAVFNYDYRERLSRRHDGNTNYVFSDGHADDLKFAPEKNLFVLQ